MSNADNKLEKLVLGTAQLGLNYGINNEIGQPKIDVSEQLILNCEKNGVKYLDTARAYGDSEEVIGSVLNNAIKTDLKVITKFNTALNIENINSKDNIYNAVDSQIQSSLDALRQEKLYVVLLHRAADLTSCNGAVWSRLLELKLTGSIEKLGVSVQSPNELEEALKHDEVEYIQMPFNILDSRWMEAIKGIKKTKLEREIKIHVRSVFLQGLLLTENISMWAKANCNDSDLIQAWLKSKTAQFNRSSSADLCLSYVRSLKWIDALVIGMESVDQLNDNIKLFGNPDLAPEEIEDINTTRPNLDEETLNPAKWKA